MLETVLFVTAGLAVSLGDLSMRQARYYDGDANAFWYRRLAWLHTPRHPHAVRAKRRGWALMGLGAVLVAAGLLAPRLG